MVKARDQNNLVKVTLTNKVTTADGSEEKRSVDLFVTFDNDVETLICLVIDFEAAHKDESLALSDAKKFLEFRKCANFIVCDKWEDVAGGVTHDAAGFTNAMSTLIKEFAPDSSFADQKTSLGQLQETFRNVCHGLR